MNRIFVDTSGWGCFVDTLQDFHSQAKAVYQKVKRDNSQLVTTNYIIAETVALLASPLRIPKTKSIDFINGIKKSSLVEIIHIDEDLDAKSWELLENRPDKNWSLADCSSFVVMQDNKILEALTTDHHFEQAGFIRLLK